MDIDWSDLWQNLAAGSAAPELPPNFELPVLPIAVSRFNQESRHPDVSNDRLAKIIESDTGLTCDVLQYVNGTQHGIRAKIASVKHAISMLGVQRLKLTVMTTSLTKAIAARKSKLINSDQFSADSLQRAIFARNLAPLFECDPEIAYSTGLLQDILLPVLTNDLYDRYIDYWDGQRYCSQSLSGYEQQVFGWTHSQATAFILKQWEFPDELVCAIFHHHHGLRLLMDKTLGKSIVGLAAVSGLLPGTVQQDPDGLSQLCKLDSIWPQLKLTNLAESTAQEFCQAHPQSGYPTLKRRLEKLHKQTELQKV